MDETLPIRDRDTSRADAIRAGTQILLRGLDIIAVAELGLPGGRRADLFGIDAKGNVTIVEIKSGAQDFLSDTKWQDYLEFCDQYFFAVDPDFPTDLLPEDQGMIIADRHGAEIMRPAAIKDKLPAARRKKMLSLFGRKAADRLARLEHIVGREMTDES